MAHRRLSVRKSDATTKKHIFLRRALVICATLTVHLAPARALVGATPDGRFGDRVVMILTRGDDKAGFCSALVLNSRMLLTAAFCVRPVSDMSVFYRDASGAPISIPVEATVVHPLYRPDAIQKRLVSIPLALVETARPLDPRFVGAVLASGELPAVGTQVVVSGYGGIASGDWGTGGVLRSVNLAVREPASTMLIWAADPQGGEAGACNGDAGGPIWSPDGRVALAITAWAQARNGKGCGGLTQGPWLAPLRGWIEESERKLDGPASSFAATPAPFVASDDPPHASEPAAVEASPVRTTSGPGALREPSASTPMAGAPTLASVPAPVAAPTSASTSLPLLIKDRAAFTSIMLGNQPAIVLVDTGATSMSVTTSVANQLVASGQATDLGNAGTTTNADGDKREARFISINTVIIAGHELHDIRAVVAPDGADMLLGFSVLNRISSRFAIDAANSRLVFE